MTRIIAFKGRTIARRYAKALFDLAQEDQKIDAVLSELNSFSEALQKIPDLFRALEDPEVNISQKRQLLRDVTRFLGISQIVTNAILLLTQKNRLALFAAIVDEYRKTAEMVEKLTRAEAKIADPSFLTDVKKRIEEIISQTLKRKAICDVVVDSSIIGGVVVKIGDVALDASISGCLAKMKEELL